jgi:hypothetical protein
VPVRVHLQLLLADARVWLCACPAAGPPRRSRALSMLLLRCVAAAVATAAPASTSGRALQQLQAACPCEQCVDAMGQSVADCESLGLDCGCLYDCKCQQCVVAMGQTVAGCESLGLDCSCYTTGGKPAGVSGSGGKACRNLEDRTTSVNDECCNDFEASQDCSSGRPATCNLDCARVLLPFFNDCAEALGTAAGLFDGVIGLCHMAEAAGSARPPTPPPPPSPPRSHLVGH